MPKIIPAILSGGFGSRLWPLSRRERPKQFLPLFDGESLFQKTCKRTMGDGFAAPLVISNQDHRFLIGEQLQELGVEAQSIVLEPCGRNTAAPAALAAMMALETDEETLVLLLPSDHLIGDEDAFKAAVELGVPAASDGAIVTFGIKPEMAHTGYGYIKFIPSDADALMVDRFVEKPTQEVAERFVSEGTYLWNAGIFLFSAKAMKESFLTYAPDVWNAVSEAYIGARADLDFLRLDAHAFEKVPSISIDYAIMEKQPGIRCVPMDPQWNDLGSWRAIWETMPKDDDGNTSLSEAIFEDSKDCLVYSDDALVSVLGLNDVLVVNTKDALLVASKEHAEQVKNIVARLEAEKRPETVQHRRVYRPWGWTEEISRGDRFRVQSMMIKPGQGLTLQRHIHRAEHWVVMGGTLEVSVNGSTKYVSENESVFVPLGAPHKLHNPGMIDVRMIEVQSGALIHDDDILREPTTTNE
ncbi:mannose-1-phosphate guanylyltransferase/mannose-6-phosphate isomerase [Pseudovibrio exalbescens]|uniref:mannose-1-phosphate guanylyltransferase/mannose-6-phosphate isomerase n=1 Tax=Pseudovibrio exalbescens TaxID=197461 RepID=UPI002366E34D|nr:mannose-1-phosphate guanylyltransferase/mannose-6-phosphate isomerase [Pseudovibrio exalbescens]MDD7909087.1 mannose-1-phosphate guanylyltransferase/mannose-6-phosphate isomerase [Pseudovibrio exalbescens]